MRTFRSADFSDLAAVYRIQDNPFRQTALLSPLPSLERFLETKTRDIQEGKEHLFVMENDGKLDGYVEFTLANRFWVPAVWGVWLRTLIYAASRVAFDVLNFPKVNWFVRRSNLRMIRLCELFQFRETARERFTAITEGFQFIATGFVSIYELTAEEFQGKSATLQRNAMQFAFLDQKIHRV